MLRCEGARAVAARIADLLASPAAVRSLKLTQGWWPQSLAYGAVGVALLHIERAHRGDASWQRAHDWLACAAADPATGGDGSHLYHGAPALAFALNTAADRSGRYARALDTLDQHITTTTRHRLEHAHARIDRGELPALAEFDTVRGLTGMGALLLRREVHFELARAVLAYLVRLTQPIRHQGEFLPGWWSLSAPSGRLSPAFPQGHANTGVAHGIGGPLALLSLAARRGITVEGHIEAIQRICRWLDQWRQDGPSGPWWPYWVTRDQLHTRQSGGGPSRPSWCYGTAGLARAQQLAALATGDTARQRMAETALLHAVKDPRQLGAITDWSLCHGFAGLAHITQLVAADAITPGLPDCLPHLLTPSTSSTPDAAATTLLHAPPDVSDIGLLEGAAGVALALLTQDGTTATPSAVSGWDACLLLN